MLFYIITVITFNFQDILNFSFFLKITVISMSVSMKMKSSYDKYENDFMLKNSTNEHTNIRNIYRQKNQTKFQLFNIEKQDISFIVFFCSGIHQISIEKREKYFENFVTTARKATERSLLNSKNSYQNRYIDRGRERGRSRGGCNRDQVKRGKY